MSHRRLGPDHSGRYPGFIWRSSSLSERTFVKPGEDSPSIIEVLGEFEQIKDHKGNVLATHQKVAAILRDDECRLYELLGWQKDVAGHATVLSALSVRNMFFFAGVFFVIFTFLLTLRDTDPRLASLSFVLFVLFVLVLSFTGAFLAVEAPHFAVSSWRRRVAWKKIDTWLRDYSSREFNHAYVEDLLVKLGHADDARISGEALRALARGAIHK